MQRAGGHGIRDRVRRLLDAARDGPTALEYMLILGAIAIILVVVLALLEGSVADVLSTHSNSV